MLPAVQRFIKESFLGLVVSGLMLPGAIAFAAVLLFVTSPFATSANSKWHGAVLNSALNRSPSRVCFFAAVLAIGFCAVLGAAFCRRFGRASDACPGPWSELHQGFDQVKQRLAAGCVDDEAAKALAKCVDVTAHQEYLQKLFTGRSPSGLTWLLGAGYVDAWQRLHALEEAALYLQPEPLLLAEALADEVRLDGSSIPQNKALLNRLRVAVSSLSGTAAEYLIEGPPAAPQTNNAAPQTDKNEARAALMQVRAAINEFRDSRREGLIRGRNRLFATVIFAGITGCVLLYVAILSGAPKASIVAAAAFYLVGAVVGLVRLLQVASTSEVAQDDYGLGVVRLIQTPLFSGLAAVGGVVLVQLAQLQGTGSAKTVFHLAQTFDLGRNPYGLVASGFFGLTPSLLFTGLQNRIEKYKTDLSSSGSSEAQPGG
jgi:hypothetical protein